MIRESTSKDTDKIMEIWLSANLQSHSFIPQSYWLSNFEAVKTQYLPNSKTYVYTDDSDQIQAFISLQSPHHIAALFVSISCQSQGIGSKLLQHLQSRHPLLTLKAYSQNLRAIKFYRAHSFQLLSQSIDPTTNQPELLLSWSLPYQTISDPNSHSSR